MERSIIKPTDNVKKTYQIVKIDEIVGLPGNFGKR